MFLPSPYIYYCKLYARFTADANLSWLSAAGPCEQRGDKEEISAAKTSKIRHKNVNLRDCFLRRADLLTANR